MDARSLSPIFMLLCAALLWSFGPVKPLAHQSPTEMVAIQDTATEIMAHEMIDIVRASPSGTGDEVRESLRIRILPPEAIL